MVSTLIKRVQRLLDECPFLTDCPSCRPWRTLFPSGQFVLFPSITLNHHHRHHKYYHSQSLPDCDASWRSKATSPSGNNSVPLSCPLGIFSHDAGIQTRVASRLPAGLPLCHWYWLTGTDTDIRGWLTLLVLSPFNSVFGQGRDNSLRYIW